MQEQILKEFEEALIGEDLYGNYILDYDIMVEILVDDETDILEAMDIIESNLRESFLQIEPYFIIIKRYKEE